MYVQRYDRSTVMNREAVLILVIGYWYSYSILVLVI